MSAVETRPTGTATFFFSDIEGSTRLLQSLGERYSRALTRHHELMRRAFAAHDGRELRLVGDSFFTLFNSAFGAVAASVDAQKALAAEAWPDGAAFRVRIGLHTGEAAVVGGEYVGIDVHRAARIASAAHGGQVLVSGSVRAIVEDALAGDVRLRDLGEHRLKDLSRPEHLYQVDAGGLPTEFPPLNTLDRTPNNLPTQLTSFVGREAEVREVRRLLKNSRLLTLTGPGGTGKTRLALQAAAEVSADFPDGVYFVGLSSVVDPQLVLPVVMQTLGVQEAAGQSPVDQLAAALKNRKVLLVLDNFEQLVPAGTAVAELLHATSETKVVVTSRAVLHVYGEHEYPVPPLGLPDMRAHVTLESMSQYESVKLFIERALAVKPDFTVTNENAPALAQVTTELDGLPLAIELAAARVKLFSPQAMLPRLEKRLALLRSGPRDLPGRQQTLRGAIEWSYDLLDAAQKRLFARFSIFARGARLTDAETVCGQPAELGMEVLDGLTALADQSLLRLVPMLEEPRFFMLQTIREFGQERLTESPDSGEIGRAHALAFLELAERAQPYLAGPDQKSWLDRLEEDHDNLRAALDWFVANGESVLAMRFVSALWRFWQIRGHLNEGREKTERVLRIAGSDHPVERAAALEAAGGIAHWQGDQAGSEHFYAEALELQRQIGDKEAIARALYNSGFPLFHTKVDSRKGVAVFSEARDLYRELGDRQGVGRCLWGLGNVLYYSEHPDMTGAARVLDEAIALFRELDDAFDLGWALHTRGCVAVHAKDLETARAAFNEGMHIFSQATDRSGIVILLDDLAELARANGERERALRLKGAFTALKRATGVELAAVIVQLEGRMVADTRPSGEADARAWEQGQAMDIDQAVAYALRT